MGEPVSVKHYPLVKELTLDQFFEREAGFIESLRDEMWPTALDGQDHVEEAKKYAKAALNVIKQVPGSTDDLTLCLIEIAHRHCARARAHSIRAANSPLANLARAMEARREVR